MKKLYVATIRVAVDAKACGNLTHGACEWFSGLLSDNTEVFDWAYGSRKGSYPKPKLIEVDARKYAEGDLF